MSGAPERRGDPERAERLSRALFDAGPVLPEERDVADELFEVERRLRSAGEAQLDALLSEREPELESRAIASMRALMESTPAGATPAHGTRRGLWIAAAAAAALLVAWLALPGEAPLETGTLLGPEDSRLVLVHPVQGERFERFAWRGVLPEGGWYHLRIWAADADPLAAPLVDVRLEEPAWTPGAETTLPTAIRVVVQALDARGEPLARGEARLEAPPR